MAKDRAKPGELDQEKYDADDNVKIICLGDSAVGKSKYVERRARPPWVSVTRKASGGAKEHGFCGSPERGVLLARYTQGKWGVAQQPWGWGWESRHGDSGDRAASRSPGGSCGHSPRQEGENGVSLCVVCGLRGSRQRLGERRQKGVSRVAVVTTDGDMKVVKVLSLGDAH